MRTLKPLNNTPSVAAELLQLHCEMVIQLERDEVEHLTEIVLGLLEAARDASREPLGERLILRAPGLE